MRMNLSILLTLILCVTINAQYFQIVEGNFTWEQAKLDAEDRGGRLAVLNTQTKIDAANSYVKSFSAYNGDLWIGLTDEVIEAEWRWIDGSILIADNWRDGEPNNVGPGGENYAHMRAANLEWNDEDANEQKSYIMEPADSDGDGLSDNIETNTGTYISIANTGTDPNNSDTDGDGVADGDEVLKYELVIGSYTWEEARLDALNSGGRLAVISNVNKLNEVMNLLISEGDNLPINRVWIGARKVDGQWKWIDGTDWSLGFITPFLDPDGGQYYVELTTAENKVEGVSDWPGYAWPWDSQFGNYSTSYILEGFNTDPNNPDSDGDGLNDSVETNTGTFISSTDTGTDPNDSDTDNDGLLDGFETNTNVYVSSSDTGTNPLLADSDFDSITDGYETFTGIWVSGEDTGTDPNKGDTDGDTLLDNVETNSGTFVNPSNTGTDPNNTDSDGDGFTDIYEVNTSYDPTSTEDTPDAELIVKTAIELEFHGASGGIYRIEHSTNLVSWTTVEDNIQGESALVERLHSVDDYNRRYFRVIRTD